MQGKLVIVNRINYVVICCWNIKVLNILVNIWLKDFDINWVVTMRSSIQCYLKIEHFAHKEVSAHMVIFYYVTFGHHIIGLFLNKTQKVMIQLTNQKSQNVFTKDCVWIYTLRKFYINTPMWIGNQLFHVN